MYCGNAEGHILSPYIVYKADSMRTTWTENGPKGACYNCSKSGWFDSSCFTGWFESLLLPELKKTSGKHVLIGDNLSSHMYCLCVKKTISSLLHFLLIPCI